MSESQRAPTDFRAEKHRRISEKLQRELGPVIVGLLSEPAVIEIMLNPDGTLWVERLAHLIHRASA